MPARNLLFPELITGTSHPAGAAVIQGAMGSPSPAQAGGRQSVSKLRKAAETRLQSVWQVWDWPGGRSYRRAWVLDRHFLNLSPAVELDLWPREQKDPPREARLSQGWQRRWPGPTPPCCTVAPRTHCMADGKRTQVGLDEPRACPALLHGSSCAPVLGPTATLPAACSNRVHG